MTKFKYFLFPLFMAILVMSITGCSQAKVTEKSPTAEPVVENTPVPTAALPIEPEVQNNCLECHTDKERLIDNAIPVLEVVSENEGAG